LVALEKKAKKEDELAQKVKRKTEKKIEELGM